MTVSDFQIAGAPVFRSTVRVKSSSIGTVNKTKSAVQHNYQQQSRVCVAAAAVEMHQKCFRASTIVAQVQKREI